MLLLSRRVSGGRHPFVQLRILSNKFPVLDEISQSGLDACSNRQDGQVGHKGCNAWPSEHERDLQRPDDKPYSRKHRTGHHARWNRTILLGRLGRADWFAPSSKQEPQINELREAVIRVAVLMEPLTWTTFGSLTWEAWAS